MDQQAQVVEVRRRRSRAETEPLVAEYETGGLSSGLAVALTGGRRIEVGFGFNARTLAQLPGVLERH